METVTQSINAMLPEERLNYFEVQQFDTESVSYFREYTEDEIKEFEREYIELSKKLEELNDEMNSKIARYKSMIKKESAAHSHIMSRLRVRGEHDSGVFYKVPDHDRSMMLFYNENGEFHYERPMDPHEKQRRLNFSVSVNEMPFGEKQAESVQENATEDNLIQEPFELETAELGNETQDRSFDPDPANPDLPTTSTFDANPLLEEDNDTKGPMTPKRSNGGRKRIDPVDETSDDL